VTLRGRSGAVEDCRADHWRADDGSPLSFDALPVGSVPAPGDQSIWAWADWFPPETTLSSPVTLGEGGTPLVAAPWLGEEVLLKLDHLNPTGSFKDRGVALVVTALKSEGGTRLLEDSSGNGGSSLAAYAGAAGLAARVLVPNGTSAGKIAAARAYGADVVVVPGDRAAASGEALRQVAESGE